MLEGGGIECRIREDFCPNLLELQLGRRENHQKCQLEPLTTRCGFENSDKSRMNRFETGNYLSVFRHAVWASLEFDRILRGLIHGADAYQVKGGVPRIGGTLQGGEHGGPVV